MTPTVAPNEATDITLGDTEVYTWTNPMCVAFVQVDPDADPLLRLWVQWNCPAGSEGDYWDAVLKPGWMVTNLPDTVVGRIVIKATGAAATFGTDFTVRGEAEYGSRAFP
jgi:hypothetical protein